MGIIDKFKSPGRARQVVFKSEAPAGRRMIISD